MEGGLFGVAGLVGRYGGGDPDVEPLDQGGVDAVEGALPAARAAVVVVGLGGGAVSFAMSWPQRYLPGDRKRRCLLPAIGGAGVTALAAIRG